MAEAPPDLTRFLNPRGIAIVGASADLSREVTVLANGRAEIA